MDRKFLLIPFLAAGAFLAQSGQQRAEALSAPTVNIGQTSGQTPSPTMTLVRWGDRGEHGYGHRWGRGGYGGGWGRRGYSGDWGGRGVGGFGGRWGGRGYGGDWGRHGYGGRWGRGGYGGRWG